MKCFDVFCTIFQAPVKVLKLALHKIISHDKYLSPCGTKAYLKL